LGVVRLLDIKDNGYMVSDVKLLDHSGGSRRDDDVGCAIRGVR
jgi:hypothetical protein